MKKTFETTKIFNYKIYSRDTISLLKSLSSSLKEKSGPLSIFTPNPEQIVLSSKTKVFAKNLGFADILIPDGIGLVFSSKILSFFKENKAIQERITGIDLTKSLLKIARSNNYKVLVIGGRDYDSRNYVGWRISNFSSSNENSVIKNKTNTKNKTIHWVEGYNKVSNQTDGENKTITSAIKTIKPDIVFVALGAPYQEAWVVENSTLLEQVGVSIVMVVGGTFDVLLGKITRAPEWMQKLGLEWLYRLTKEPWRWRRQLKLVEFMKLVIKEIKTY